MPISPVIITKSGHVFSEAEIQASAAEAEAGYDLSNQPPIQQEIWIAELVSDGEVKGRLVLTTREEADQALAGSWRIVRYVRADLTKPT